MTRQGPSVSLCVIENEREGERERERERERNFKGARPLMGGAQTEYKYTNKLLYTTMREGGV